VRQALNLAIDREALARRFFPRNGTPDRGPFFPKYWAVEDAHAETAWPYDPAKARALLKAATGGAPSIELECLVVNETVLHADIAAALEAQLEQVHVRLRLVALPLAEVSRRMAAGDFELVSAPMTTGYGVVAPYFFWHSPAGYLRSHYSAADEALDALATAASDDAERAAARALLEVMHRDPPAAFVLPIPTMRAVRTNWRVPNNDPDIRRTLPYWTLAETPPCGAR
jgi:ABC-type transport system substrate-binding protein